MRKKFLHVSLSKELRKKYGKRSITIKKGDTVKIMKGKFRKKQGKITQVDMKRLRVYAEGIQIKKQDGSKANVPLRIPNLQIVELNLETRRGKISEKKKEEKVKEQKTENKVTEEKK